MEANTVAHVEASSAPTKTVVVVDDAPENLAFSGHVSRAPATTVFTAKSGEECLTLLTRVTAADDPARRADAGHRRLRDCRLIRKRKDLAGLPVADAVAASGGRGLDVKSLPPQRRNALTSSAPLRAGQEGDRQPARVLRLRMRRQVLEAVDAGICTSSRIIRA